MVEDRYARLESAVDQLQLAVQALQQRVELLEGSRVDRTPGEFVASQMDARRDAGVPSAARPKRDPYDPIVVLTLTGRLFLVLAGGFFLRAMTEAGVLAPPVGVGVAFAYGLLWLALGDRASRRQQASSALFHVLGAAMVVFPLLIEATTRFKVIATAGSAVGLMLLTAAFLFVATRRKAHAIAWIAVFAALLTSLVLFLKTGFSPVFAFHMIALGVATLWLAHVHGWTLIRWPVALVADLVVAGLAARAVTLGHAGGLRIAVLLQLTLVIGYLGGIAVRTLLRERNVSLFEATQTLLVLAIGFGGAIYLTRAAGMLPILMGLASLVSGAACYGLAFRFVGRHEGHERNVRFYATLGLVLMLAGFALDLHGSLLGVAFGALAVIASVAWFRLGRLDLLAHGVAYAAAAGVASGALRYSTWALVGSPESWAPPGGTAVVVCLASALTVWMAARRPHPEGGLPASVMRVLLALMLVWLASGCVTGYLATLTVSSVDGTVDLGALATVRTGVLAAATLLVAWGARHDRLREWSWLVYPLLVFIGLKMVAQDFKYSKPATMFIALALYGIALIVAPRLRRSRDRTSGAAASRSQPAQSA